MPGSNSRPNVSEGYEVPTELPGSTGYAGKIMSFTVYVCVCFLPIHSGHQWFVGRTSRCHTGGRSHRISHPHLLSAVCIVRNSKSGKHSNSIMVFSLLEQLCKGKSELRHLNLLLLEHPPPNQGKRCNMLVMIIKAVVTCFLLCFLPFHSGHQVR